MVYGSVGTNMFRHMIAMRDLGHKEIDVLDDGYNACAFYVSSILKVFSKISNFHATVDRVVEDLKESGWQIVDRPQAGDIIVWEAQKFDDGWHKHIGFYIGDGRAISNSWTKKVPIEHDLYFGEKTRQIEEILRTDWRSSE